MVKRKSASKKNYGIKSKMKKKTASKKAISPKTKIRKTKAAKTKNPKRVTAVKISKKQKIASKKAKQKVVKKPAVKTVKSTKSDAKVKTLKQRKTPVRRTQKNIAIKQMSVVSKISNKLSLQVGQAAPDFTLLADDGEKFSLHGLRGKKVILYFYPKDDTPGCTKESCDFRDFLYDFTAKNVEIIGISKDNQTSHQQFKQKYSLPFTLLSEEGGKVCEAYGVLIEKEREGQKYMGIERSTFLIDEQGNVQRIWRNVKVDGHIADILTTVR
jgi:peroxiredoxin Q/BCP